MRAISVNVDRPLERDLTATLTPDGIWIRHTARGVLRDTHTDVTLPFKGAEAERLDEGRSLGKAAAGAIVGGILTGGIGLLAGAALGGRKKHSIIYRVAECTAVLELSTAEYQTLAGRVAKGQASIVRKTSTSLTFLSWVLLVIGGLFALAAIRSTRNETKPPVVQAEAQIAQPPPSVQVPAKAAKKPQVRPKQAASAETKRPTVNGADADLSEFNR